MFIDFKADMADIKDFKKYIKYLHQNFYAERIKKFIIQKIENVNFKKDKASNFFNYILNRMNYYLDKYPKATQEDVLIYFNNKSSKWLFCFKKLNRQ